MRSLAVVLLFLVVGCTTPAGIEADTPEKRLIVADQNFIAALQTVKDAVDAGAIDPQSRTGQLVKNAIIGGYAALAAAHQALAAGDQDTYTAQLAAAHGALEAIRTVLLELKGGP